MAYLVVLILDCVETCLDVIRAWEEAGVSGITILESTGMGRLRAVLQDDLPLMPSMRDVLAGRELHHRTLLTVVRDEETMDRVIAATQQTVGDLNQPNTGLLFVTPVVRVLGLERKG
ncbi:MAG: P-II family nitrogen regulator [Anaerolineae bacterium]|jgi:nitrogen regulatory protein PII|nr:P-II family nitrogen regulator [Anaerolineae bacterium]